MCNFWVHSKNCEKRLLASSCLPATTQLPLDNFHNNLYLSIFWKSVQKIHVSLKSDKTNKYLTWRPVFIYDSILINPSQNEKCFRWKLWRENQNTQFEFSTTFLKNTPFMRKCGKNGRATQATDDNLVQRMRFYMLDSEGYKHTLRICNTYWFFIAMLVMWKLLNVTMLYVHYLSCFPFYISWINSEPLWFTQLKWFEIFEYTLNKNIHTHNKTGHQKHLLEQI